MAAILLDETGDHLAQPSIEKLGERRCPGFERIAGLAVPVFFGNVKGNAAVNADSEWEL